MKILMTTSFYPPNHIGGDAVHVKHLAEALVEKGHIVHVLFSEDAARLKNLKLKSYESNGVILHPINSRLGKYEPVRNYLFGARKTTRIYFNNLIKTEDFDVVHHHNISLLGFDLIKKIGNYKNIHTAHDPGLICDNLARKCKSCLLSHKLPRVYMRKNLCKDLDLVITPSKFYKELFKKNISNVVHIYNSVDVVAGTKTNGNYFMYVSVLEEHKGIRNLVRVFNKLDEKLIVVGEGSLLKELEQKAKENIEFKGKLQYLEIINLLLGAKALILPSTWNENNPLVILEAYSTGTPVIGSDKGGIPELVRLVDEKLVFKNDYELAGIIRNFKDYSEQMIKGIFLKNFTKENYIKNYLKQLK